ncbi:MAG: helix-turn-helix domain-containing protein [Thermomicrobiales bacterium]
MTTYIGSMKGNTETQRDMTVFNEKYHHAVELIGRRWTGAIIRAMLNGAKHFSELTATIPGLSDRLVSVRLKELEAEGIVERIVIPDKPVRIEYLLTQKGKALDSVVQAVDSWAEDWVPNGTHSTD